MTIASINPANGELIETFLPLTAEEINQKITQSELAFQYYRHTSFAQRSVWLTTVANVLLTEKESLARTITLEMGKPIGSAIAEVEKCALVCHFYAENGEGFLSPQYVPTDATKSYICYEPLGIILAVMPWNFPFWQVFRFAAPALMAGNVGLLKHASNVPQSALLIANILQKGGFPKDVFQTLLINSSQIPLVLGDRRVKAATLTGSEAAGQSLAAIAGQELKKTVLELGGSDPYIVLPSAELPKAIDTAVIARMINNGQSCIAAKRFILHQDIALQFTEKLVEKFATLQIGNPLDPKTQIGPLATPKILTELERQVTESVQSGARVLIGGKRLLNNSGNFYLPTILTNIPHNSPAYSEEFFGPVALIFVVCSLQEAIILANDTNFGLGASAWTNDRQEQQLLIEKLEAGAVFINTMVKSDPQLPFGGIKRSGYGRELGREGILEFVNTKTVWLA